MKRRHKKKCAKILKPNRPTDKSTDTIHKRETVLSVSESVIK